MRFFALFCFCLAEWLAKYNPYTLLKPGNLEVLFTGRNLTGITHKLFSPHKSIGFDKKIVLK